jgi:hypothetical protein
MTIFYSHIHPINWRVGWKLTSWSWAILEKPPVVQLFKNFQALYGTRRFITVFTKAHVLSQINPVHITPSYLPKILILYTHLRLGLLSGLFPFGFPTNMLHAFLFSLFMLHALPISSSTWSFWFYLAKNTRYEVPHQKARWHQQHSRHGPKIYKQIQAILHYYQ